MEAAILLLGILALLIWGFKRTNKPADRRLLILQEFESHFLTYAKNPRNQLAKQRLLKIIDEYTENVLALSSSRGNNQVGALLDPYFEPLVTTNQLKMRMQEVLISFLKYEYDASLVFLKENPTSADAHQQTLSLGREYAAAAREGGKVTIFDETALANDIRAATANASQTQNSPDTQVTPQATSSTSLKDRIAALTLMKESGLLSEEEFDRKRREILDQI